METETLALCIHNVPVKFHCEKCDESEKLKILLIRMNDLEEWTRKEEERIHDRIKKLEKENLMRQDTSACIDRAYDEECRRLDNLISYLKMEIRELKRFQNVTHAQYQNVIKKRQPHKCPLCDFSGAILLESMDELGRFSKSVMKTDDGKYFIWCKACKGEGIVWG